MSLVLTIKNLARAEVGTSRGLMRISWARSCVCENVSKSETFRDVSLDLTRVKICLDGTSFTVITHRVLGFLPIRIKIGRLEAGIKRHDVFSMGLESRLQEGT
jgi:hypothetical protein